MLSLSKALARDVVISPTHFCNKLPRTLALRRVFSGPMAIEEVSWVATDATPQVIGAVDWRDMSYIRVDAEEITKDYLESDGRHAQIADKKLTGLAIGSVSGYAYHPDASCSAAYAILTRYDG